MDLENLRTNIDATDQQIIELLSKRFELTDEVGRQKAKKGVAPRDTERYQAMLIRLKQQAKQHGLSEELVGKIYHEIHEVSIARQENIT